MDIPNLSQLPAVSSLDTAHLIALAAAVGWASGIRLYAVIFITGLVGLMGWVPLPSGLAVLGNPVVLGASGFMVFVEFFADKIPGLDSLWDMVHSVIRVPAGAALAGSVIGMHDNAAMATVAAILGGTLAATSYGAKASTRAAINTSPEPFSNIGMSLAEDATVMGGMWLAYNHPIPFIIAVVLFTILAIWVIIKMFSYIRRLVRRVVAIFSGRADPDAPKDMRDIAIPPSFLPKGGNNPAPKLTL